MAETFLHYLSAEPWAMEPTRLQALLSQLSSAVPAGVPPNPVAISYAGSVVRIPIHGVILKSAAVAEKLRWYGIAATSTEDVAAKLGSAALAEDVSSIVLDVDSPGGTVAGVQELADLVAGVSAQKSVVAEVSDLAASAAYWIAAQANEITANASAAVGSIGVYTTIVDASRLAENAGVKIHVVSSHELKGAGVFGAPVTQAQLDDLKRNISGYADLFEAAVARGRGLTAEQTKAVATGQVWLAQEAVGLGLIDRVRSTAAAVVPALVDQQTPDVVGQRETEMAEKATLDATAEVAELKAQLDEANRTAAANADKITAMKAEQRAALMSRYADRITPASYAEIKGFGDAIEPARFEAFLSALPVVTRSERLSTDAQPAVESNDPRMKLPAGEDKVADILNMDKADMDFHSRIVAFSRDGKFRMNDGRLLTREQLQAERVSFLRKAGAALGAFVAVLMFSTVANATALSAARATECKSSGVSRACLMTASKTVYSGGLVMQTSAGTCEAAAASAGNHGVIGVASESKTSGSSGSYWLHYSDDVICKFAGTSLGQDDVGAIAFSEDDQTVDETVGTNEPVAGIVYQYVSTSVGWIYINSAVNCGRVNTLTDPVTLTTTLTLENGGTILNDTDGEIQFGEASEDISLGFATSNEVVVSTDTGVTRVDFGSIGVKTAAPMMLLSSQLFCGQGANGTTTSYIGPVLPSLADDMRTYVFGAAGCDGLDSTTEATADAVVSYGAIKVVGMQCLIDDGGTDDVYTFYGRDDTANITGLTCTVTLDGANNDTCTVILDEPVTVAAASAMAVSQAAATNDDCSSCDTECRIFYTY